MDLSHYACILQKNGQVLMRQVLDGSWDHGREPVGIIWDRKKTKPVLEIQCEGEERSGWESSEFPLPYFL